MSLSRLKAALDGGPSEEVVAAIAALDDKERHAVLGRARASSYGISATNPELGYFADEAAILLALLLPSHPKAAAIRASATQLRVWRRRGGPLPLPASVFAGWPAVERLELERIRVEGPLDVSGMQALVYLTLEETAIEGLVLPPGARQVRADRVTGIPALDQLGGPNVTLVSAQRLPDLTTLGALGQLPRLEFLSVDAAPALVDLGTGPTPALQHLHLARCPGIRSLDGLPGGPHLADVRLTELSIGSLRGLRTSVRAELRLTECALLSFDGLPPLDATAWEYQGKDLTSLDGISVLSRLTSITLDTPALRDLTPLAGLPALAQLTLVRSPVRDLAALGGCKALEHLALQAMQVDLTTLPTTLRALDLRGCASIVDVSPLLRQADLRAVALHGTGVTPESVPAALAWACSWDADVDLSKLARRARPKPGAKPKVDPGLLAELGSTDAAVAAAALNRLTPAETDELLKQARMSSGKLDTTHPLLADLPHRASLLWALVLHAPDGLARAETHRDQASLRWHPEEHYTGRWPIDAARLARYSWVDLGGVRLSNVGALKCKSLTLTASELEDPGALGRLELTSLDLREVPAAELTVPPGVTSLRLKDVGRSDLRGLEGPEVTFLSLSGVGFASLDGIQAFPTLTTLWLERLPNLRDIAPLATMHPLDSVSFHGCGVSSLEGMPAVANLTLWGCPELTSLRGISRSVEKLRVSDCPALTSADGLEGSFELHTVELRDCRTLSDVAALDGLPALRALDVRRAPELRTLPLERCDLRVVMVAGTGIDIATVPEPIRWACSKEPYGGMEKLALRIPPTPPSGTRADPEQLHAILRLLRTPDVATIDQGLELTGALEDPALWDALLEGTELEGSARDRSLARIVSRRFSGPTAAYILLALVDLAPPSCARARALREGLLGFTSYGTRDEEGRRPFDPRRLRAFPALTRVSLDRVGPFVGTGEAPLLPSLTSVGLREVWSLPNLGWLGRAPELRDLSLWYCKPLSLAGLEAPNLTRLTCYHSLLLDLAPLLRLPSLKEVTLTRARPDDPFVAALRARGVEVRPG